jgi:glycosyltransferase involved in cell wall biosynthesis
MKKPQIAFCLRRDYVQLPAGDIIQMERWKKILTKMGYNITIFSGNVTVEELQKVDIVFIWHLDRLHESLPFWQIARELNKKIWLVPTCWSKNPPLSFFRSFSEDIKLLLRKIFSPKSFSCGKTIIHWKQNRQRLLHESDRLLVNSEAERIYLKAQGAPDEKISVIPNTIDVTELENIPRLPWEERSGIIHIGHFCPRKNQMQLIQKLSRSNVKITFIGTWRPMHKFYHAHCQILGERQHNFPGALPHDEVLKIMGKSRLCISTSTSETPGLSNLEAAMMGCNLILPDIAPVKEYFGDDAIYISPEELSARFLRRAESTCPTEKIRQRILSNYTEEQTEQLFKTLLESDCN